MDDRWALCYGVIWRGGTGGRPRNDGTDRRLTGDRGGGRDDIRLLPR